MTTARTIAGDIPAAEMGVTLPHEHLFVNLMREYRLTGLLNNVDLMTEEVGHFRNAGGRTIIDVTTAEITAGSDGNLDRALHGASNEVTDTRAPGNVASLLELSKRSGINVIAGTGHYRDPYLDREWFDRTSTDRIAERMIADIEDGFPGSTARAGIIGEIGTDRWYVSAAEERNFRAAARAHLRTGATITTHAARWPVGLDQVRLLLSEDVPPERIIVGHTDSVPDPSYASRLAELGVYVQFDMFFECLKAGRVVEHALASRIDMILRLSRAGHGSKILLSHDICLRDHLVSGGGAGFAFLLEHVAPRLLEHGVSAEEVELFTVDNPRRAVAM